MSPIFKTSLFTVALIAGLAASGREARAQATYVGTFAMTNGSSIRCLTDPNNAMNFTYMVTNPWAAVPAQEWAFFLLPNGFYAIMNIESTMFLQVREYSDGMTDIAVSQDKWNAGLNQMWYLYPLGNHFYALVNVANGFMLTDNSQAGGDEAQTFSWSDNLDQWWYLYFLRK